MATVYLGRAKDGRAVALKVIKDEFSLQPEFTNMFLDEAKIVSRLSHPNIVHVEELGNEGKRLYLAMELLAGQSLWHLWSACRERGVRLRYETIAWIGARVASGLHHAHELSIDGIVQGLVHRDVNASNIIVGYDGTVKIIDFGLAKARGRISQTAAGVVKGKLAYMSPEQAVGKPLDRRTDVFALAATLWEVTTDRRLFKGTDDVDTLKRVYAAKIPDPTKLVEGYPAALWEVLKRGLKRHADERWPDALAFSVALDEVAKSGKGGDASTVAKVMGELFAEQRARQERWTAEASRQDGAAAMETLRPPRLDEGAESASSIVSAAPISVRPRPIASPSASASVSASLDSLFLLAADLMAIASRTEESTTPARRFPRGKRGDGVSAAQGQRPTDEKRYRCQRQRDCSRAAGEGREERDERDEEQRRARARRCPRAARRSRSIRRAHVAVAPARRRGHRAGGRGHLSPLVNHVPKEGLEPSRPCERRILNPLRLPFRHFGSRALHLPRVQSRHGVVFAIGNFFSSFFGLISMYNGAARKRSTLPCPI